MNLELLRKEIPYKWKPGRMNNKTGVKSPEMAYVDSRDVMDLLDEVVGMGNWQCDYKELAGKMYCGIGIYTNDRWVWKWDMGTESDFEAEKGEASDAFKRAAVKWGVGRFLYDIKGKPTSNTESVPKPNTEAPKCSRCGGTQKWSEKKSKWYCPPCIESYVASKK